MKFDLKTKDLINIGVFSAIFFFAAFLPGMIGLLGPAFMFLGIGISIILNGIVTIFLLARCPKMGTLTILGTIIGAMYVLTAHPIYVLIAGFVLGFIADLIHSERGQATALNPKRGILAYAVLILMTIGPMIPIFYNSEGYFVYIASEMGQDYADAARNIFTPWVVALWAVMVFILGLVGGWIGTKTASKHFQKAGMTR